MSTTIAKIASLAKTENTGITPDLTRKMYDSLGSQHVAIVNFKVAERTEGDDDSHAVKLQILHVEPADDKDTDEYLRQLQQALYRKRSPQPALTAGDSTEPGVDGMIIEGLLHLTCPSCYGTWDDDAIAHAPGSVKDGYAPCTYSQCGHVVTDPKADCARDHGQEKAA